MQALRLDLPLHPSRRESYRRLLDTRRHGAELGPRIVSRGPVAHLICSLRRGVRMHAPPRQFRRLPERLSDRRTKVRRGRRSLQHDDNVRRRRPRRKLPVRSDRLHLIGVRGERRPGVHPWRLAGVVRGDVQPRHPAVRRVANVPAVIVRAHVRPSDLHRSVGQLDGRRSGRRGRLRVDGRRDAPGAGGVRVRRLRPEDVLAVLRHRDGHRPGRQRRRRQRGPCAAVDRLLDRHLLRRG